MGATRVYEWGRRWRARGVPILPGLLRGWLRLVHRADLSLEAQVGPGLELGYGGLGVAVDAEVRIGRECFLGHGVTLGRLAPAGGAPALGERVHVSPGAQIIGPVTIGDYAVIGANAVVTSDVAPGAIVAGVPAVELRRDPSPEESYRRYRNEVRQVPQPVRPAAAAPGLSQESSDTPEARTSPR